MENAVGATEAGSLELDLSTEAGSSCGRFSVCQNAAVYVVQLGINDAYPS